MRAGTREHSDDIACPSMHLFPTGSRRMPRRHLDRRDLARRGARHDAVCAARLRNWRRPSSLFHPSRLRHQPDLPICLGVLPAASCSTKLRLRTRAAGGWHRSAAGGRRRCAGRGVAKGEPRGSLAAPKQRKRRRAHRPPATLTQWTQPTKAAPSGTRRGLLPAEGAFVSCVSSVHGAMRRRRLRARRATSGRGYTALPSPRRGPVGSLFLARA
jgi:hypothetical protein